MFTLGPLPVNCVCEVTKRSNEHVRIILMKIRDRKSHANWKGPTRRPRRALRLSTARQDSYLADSRVEHAARPVPHINATLFGILHIHYYTLYWVQYFERTKVP